MSGIVDQVTAALGWTSTPSDEVSIIVGGKQVSGWTSVVIRMSAEVMPWTFELETTEWDSVALADVTISEGAPCQIMVGDDLVITGYVVTVLRSIGPKDHTVRVVGASKSVDLVECSAIFNTFQINNTDALTLAQKLAGLFGIKAVTPVPFPAVQIQQFDVILTETPYEIIERVCRFAAVLVYDDNTGNIILSKSGSTLASSGFSMPGNVERASCSFSMAGRYSEIRAVRQTTDTLYLSPDQQDLGGQVDLVTAVGPLKDPGVPRYRPLIIPAEMGDEGNSVTQQRVQWEINRRWGRAYAVELTCDSWRDDFGTLWGVNTLAPIFMPALKCTPSERWLIGEIVLRKDEGGTHADITLMPEQAYQPEPVLLNPLANDVGQATRDQAGAGTTPADAVTQEDLPDLPHS